MLGDAGGARAVALLEKWTGKRHSRPEDSPSVALQGWQEWFAETYPNEPPATLPVESEKNNWTYQELLSYLSSAPASPPSAQRGAAVFEKALCIKCHRYGDRGDSVGPDLTTVAQRFQKKEILESILFPSHVISDPYASQTVLTTDGETITGMVSPAGDNSIVILQSSGEKATIPRDHIDQLQRSKVSAMPEGLLNPLSLDEVLALFAYLSKPPAANELTERQPGAAETPRSTVKPSTTRKPGRVLKR
jgi:putative heme-binding domain-containing protein